MGLRTTSSTGSSKTQTARNSELVLSCIVNSNKSKLRALQPNVSISGNMAPALTEPLSPTNKLSSSAASASPRPTSNNILQNNISNSENNNNNTKNKKIVEKKLLSSKYITPQVLQKKDAFQLAFERSITGINVKGNLDITQSLKATTSSSTNTFKDKIVNEASILVKKQLTPNGPKSIQILPMGPMCDSSPLIDSNSISEKGPILIEGKDFEEAITSVNRLRKQLKNSSPINKNCDFLTHPMDLTETIPDENQHQQSKQINEQPEKTNLILSIEELPRVNTGSTVTASENDNVEETLSQLNEQNLVVNQEELSSSISVDSNIPEGQAKTDLGPSLTATTSAMGLQKEFIKDSAEMDQVLGDMDLLQVFKGFESTPGGEVLCDLAGSLALFNDVDMNYEEIAAPAKESNTEPQKEIQSDIEDNQIALQRKLDFLLRRLRKFQARYMCKHASEEIAGVFECTNRALRRKENDLTRSVGCEEEKNHPVTTASMRSFLKSIETTTTLEQSSAKKSKIGRPPLNQPIEKSLTGVTIPPLDPESTEEIAHVSGLLETQLHSIQKTLDSDITASSSGGESADEMDTYNNTIQQPLSIAKRAAWQYARDRTSIAARWLWLNCQITDIEFKIKQHNEFIDEIRNTKGPVLLEEVEIIKKSNSLEESIDPSKSKINGLLPADEIQNADNSLIDKQTEVEQDIEEDECHASARTRPYQKDCFKKRKLIQTINFHTISKKVARPSTIKCQGCKWPMNPCGLCTGRADPTAPRDLPDTMSYLDRVSLLDPGFHQVLSFTEDVPNSIDIEATSSVSDWQNRLSRCTAKSAIKGALAAQRAAEREERNLAVLENKVINETTKRKVAKKHHLDDFQINDGGTTTPLVANRLGKKLKKRLIYQKNLNRSHHRNSHHHLFSSQHNHHLKLHRNSNHFNHHQGSSSSISQTNLNNSLYKHRKVSSTVTSTNGIINSELNGNLHHSDSMDGVYLGNAPRSRNPSPSHNFGSSNYYKNERFLEKRNRNSYDIDNIVIPYSVAAATRVELLPYKEIPTPKWRVIEDDDDEITLSTNETPANEISKTECSNKNISPVPKDSPKDISCDNKSTESNFEKPKKDLTSIENKNIQHLVNNNNNQNKNNNNNNNAEEQEFDKPNTPLIDADQINEETIEDVSDEAILYRHERALIEERRKFQTFLKFPWSTRSRANRRIDSRTESSGANTPDPTSPAPNTQSVGGDQESIPSPAAPITPLENPSDVTTDVFNGQTNSMINPPIVSSLWNTVAKRNERKRTVSTKKDKDLSKDDHRRSSTPDTREVIIPPFEPHQFPLSDDVFETMLRMMPNDHQVIEDCNPSKQELSSSTCDEKVLNNNSSECFYKDGKNGLSRLHYPTTSITKPELMEGDNSHLDDFEANTLSPLVAKNPTGEDYYQNIMNACTPIIGNNINTFTSTVVCDSDTESVESGLPDDDPNDPEWKEEPE